jgi:hypothetical protein
MSTDTGSVIVGKDGQHTVKRNYIGGAAKSHVASGIDSRGNYPATWFLEWTGVASAVVATPVYTSGDVSMYNTHTFEAVTNTAKVEAQVSSGGTWLAVTVKVDGVESATIAAGKVGILIGNDKGKYYAVRMKPNAAASTNGFGAHSVS